MANDELVDSFAAELAGIDDPVKPEDEKVEGTTEIEPVEDDAQNEDTVEAEAGDEGGETLEEESHVQSIAPPTSMNAGEAENFQQLTPEMQDFVIRREQDRDAHLTRGTQTLAQDQREVDAMKTQWSEQLAIQAQTLSQIVTSEIEPPTIELRNEDPEAYEDQMAAYVHNLHSQKQAEKQLVKVQNQQAAEKQVESTKQVAKLRNLVPEFNDSEKAGPLQQRIFNYAQSVGYGNAELSNVTANDVSVLHKAMLYDDMTESGRKVVAKTPAKRAPKSTKAGASAGLGSKRQAKFDKLQSDLKKGDDRAMVGLFEMQLESEGR